jgi:hypothetical protein
MLAGMKIIFPIILSLSAIAIPIANNCFCDAAAPVVTPIQYTYGFCAWPGCAIVGEETGCQWRFNVKLVITAGETSPGKYWQVRGLGTGGTPVFESGIIQMNPPKITVKAKNSSLWMQHPLSRRQGGFPLHSMRNHSS